MKLWLYLSLIVNSITFSVCVAYAAWDANQQSSLRLYELQADARNLAQSLAAGLVDDLLADDLDKLEQSLKRTMVISHIRELSIQDAQDRLVVRVIRNEGGQLEAKFAANSRSVFDPRQHLQQTAVIDAGQILGSVQTVLDLKDLEQIRARIWRDKLLSACLISLLLSLVFFLKLRRDSRALEQASHFASLLGPIAPSSLAISSPIKELRQLQGALNQVSQLLVEQFAKQEQMSQAQQQTNCLLQESLNELGARQFAIDQHAIVSITDAAGNITYANQRFCELSAYSLEELLGQNHRLIKSNEHDADFYQELWSTIRAGKVWQGEIANCSKQGHVYWLSATIVPMLTVDGEPHHYIAICTDISFQRRTRQQLSMNQKYLEKMLAKQKQAEQQLADAQQRELEIGHQIQQSMLFGEVPAQIGMMALAVYTEPSKGVDGDFYQLIHFSDLSFDFSIGDVMGKGIPAALVGAAVKLQMNQMLASLLASRSAGHFPSPNEIINKLHQHITPQLIELDTFVTLSYLRFDLAMQQLIHINAGHNPTLLCRNDQLIQLQGDNLPLGVLEEECYQAQVTHLQLGDLLFLYSDGISEAKNAAKEEFGLARLSELVLTLYQANIPVPVLIQAVRYQVSEFEQHNPLSDDRTCLALQLLKTDEQMEVAVEYAWQLELLNELRQWLLSHIATSCLNSEERDALLLASIEAASNVLRHNQPCFSDARLFCRLRINHQAVILDLYYLGEPFTPPGTEPDFSGASDGGFGLFIIRNSVTQVDYLNPAPHVCLIHLEKHYEEQPASGPSLL